VESIKTQTEMTRYDTTMDIEALSERQVGELIQEMSRTLSDQKRAVEVS